MPKKTAASPSMKVEWRKGYNAEIVAAEIERHVVRKPGAPVGFSTFAIHDALMVVISMTDYPEDVPEPSRRNIAWAAIAGAATKGEVTAKSLLREVRRVIHEHQSATEETFHFATTVSLAISQFDIRRKLGGVAVRVASSMPTKHQAARAGVLRDARHTLVTIPPTNYSALIATVRAKTPSAAFTKCDDAVTTLRGIWNLYHNRQTARILMSGGTWKPLNKVILGPVHTIHTPDGKLAQTSWYYQPNFVVAPPPATKSDMGSFAVFEANVRRRLARVTYSDILLQGLRRYVRAMDNFDWNATYLELWATLELLTGTTGGPYERTIRRAASIYSSGQFEAQMFHALRETRNNYVHQSQSHEDVIGQVYRLKTTIEHLFEFHLQYERRFMDVDEAMEFLEIPREKAEIRRRMRLLNLAIRYRR